MVHSDSISDLELLQEGIENTYQRIPVKTEFAERRRNEWLCWHIWEQHQSASYGDNRDIIPIAACCFAGLVLHGSLVLPGVPHRHKASNRFSYAL